MILGDILGPNSIQRWGMLTAVVQRILNNTMHSSIGCTPNDLVMGGYGDTELSMFAHDPVTREGEIMEASNYVRELEDAQFELMRRSELHQEKILEAVAKKATEEGARRIYEGDIVLAIRGGLGKRPKDKLQSKYTGPYMVVERQDPAQSIVRIAHIAPNNIESRHMSDLVSCTMSHFQTVQDAIPFALQDEWTYQVEKILEHRPTGPRRINGRLRPKHRYEFLTQYKHIPLSQEEGDENPSWQPWSHVKHLQALREYCRDIDVSNQLGHDFYVSENESELSE